MKHVMIFLSLMLALAIGTFGQTQYCTSGSLDQSYEYISNVEFGTISNSSSVDVGGYTDFTSLSTDVSIFVPTPITVSITNIYSTDVLFVYVDWDNSGDFYGTDEEIELTNFGNTFVGSITAPYGTTTGSKTMRLTLFDGSFDTADPCGTFSYGEVEDYSINVVQSSACLANADFDATMISGYEFNFDMLLPYTGSNYLIDWDFGDGNFSTGLTSISHTYSAIGTYNVSCIITELADPTCADTFVVSVTAVAPPANDDCSNATLVGTNYPETITGTTVGAGIDCPGVLDWNAVWYEVTLPYGINNFSVDFCGTTSPIQSVGVVYYDSCNACNNYNLYTDISWYDCGDGVDVPSMTFNGIAGPATIYYPVYLADMMNFTVTFDVSEVVSGSNDCNTAFNYGYVNDPAQIGSTVAYDSTWFSFDVDSLYDAVVVSLCNSNYDTKLHLYDACGGNMIDENDDFCSLQSQLTMPYLSLGTYYALITGYNSAAGDYEIEIYSSSGGSCNIDAAFLADEVSGLEWEFELVNSYPSTAFSIDWDFGDGNSSSGTEYTTHTYANAGTYTVSAYVEDLFDPTCSDLVTQTIIVETLCEAFADFNWTTDVSNSMLYELWTIDPVDLTQYTILWDFGDGNTDNTTDYLYHEYYLPGVYTVSCTVTSIADPTCTETISYNITVVENYPSPWWSPVTGSNHTILLPSNANITVDGVPIGNGSYVGVFYDSLGTLACGGYTYYETGTGGNMSVTAWGEDIGHDGFVAGEQFVWKIWDINTGNEHIAQATYDLSGAFPNDAYFNVNGISGLLALEVLSSQSQNIVINQGWNIISTYIDAFEPSLDSIFSDIQSNVVIVKNGLGMVYWPSFGINAIGDNVLGEGYQVKMDVTETLTVTGLAVIPETHPINIPSGWSILGYLRDNQHSCSDLLVNIENNIVIVKDAMGLVYWPLYGINAIGNFVPGQGYQIKTTVADTLTYSANNNLTKLSYTPVNYPVYFEQVNATGNNMTIGILHNAFEANTTIGSEIGIIFNDELIGSGVYDGNNFAVSVWGDDFTTDEIEGITDGKTFKFVLWNSAEDKEYSLEVAEWIEGSDTYSQNGISVVGKFKSIGNELVNISNYPNPFTQNTTFEFYLPKEDEVTISIYNSTGKLLEVISLGNMSQGTHEYDFDGSGYSAGIYQYHLSTSDVEISKNMIINK